MNAKASAARPREVTGRMVLFCLIGFFAVVATVNAVMIRYAISTFAGTTTDSSYRAGLAYKSEEAEAAAQTALHWAVDGRIARTAPGEALLTVDVKDDRQAFVPGIEVAAKLVHPLNARFDRDIVLKQLSAGQFRGTTDAEPGQWMLMLDVTRDRSRLYRSVSRLVLP
jgi:nitrogen fixation protein FixH